MFEKLLFSLRFVALPVFSSNCHRGRWVNQRLVRIVQYIYHFQKVLDFDNDDIRCWRLSYDPLRVVHDYLQSQKPIVGIWWINLHYSPGNCSVVSYSIVHWMTVCWSQPSTYDFLCYLVLCQNSCQIFPRGGGRSGDKKNASRMDYKSGDFLRWSLVGGERDYDILMYESRQVG